MACPAANCNNFMVTASFYIMKQKDGRAVKTLLSHPSKTPGHKPHTGLPNPKYIELTNQLRVFFSSKNR